MSRVVDIDALTIGGLEALANERGMRLITKEAYEALRAGRAVQDDGLPAEAQLVDIIEQAIFEADTVLEAALLAAERIIAYRAAPALHDSAEEVGHEPE